MAAHDDKKPAATPTASGSKKAVYVGGETLVERLVPHIKQIAIGAIVLAVVCSGVFIYRAHVRGEQSDATERLGQVNDLAMRDIEAVPPTPSPSGDPTQPPAPAVAPTPDPEHPTYPDRAARATAVLAELASTHATVAHSYKAGYLLDAGKFDEAISEYKAGATGDELEAVLCREGVGLATEAKALAQTDATAKQAGLEAALAAFSSEQLDPNGPRYGFALYHTGRLQDLLGKKAEAKATFEKVKTLDDSKTELTSLVAKRLAALGDS